MAWVEIIHMMYSALNSLIFMVTLSLLSQVHAVFQSLCPSVGLSLGLAAAQKTLAAEGTALTSSSLSPFACAHPLPLSSPLSLLGPRIAPEGGDVGRLINPSLLASLMSSSSTATGGMAGAEHSNGSSSDLGPAAQFVDVLVATPGRLMAHLQGTPGFTLSHLKVRKGRSINMCDTWMYVSRVICISP